MPIITGTTTMFAKFKYFAKILGIVSLIETDR